MSDPQTTPQEDAALDASLEKATEWYNSVMELAIKLDMAPWEVFGALYLTMRECRESGVFADAPKPVLEIIDQFLIGVNSAVDNDTLWG